LATTNRDWAQTQSFQYIPLDCQILQQSKRGIFLKITLTGSLGHISKPLTHGFVEQIANTFKTT
jgi:hypothetical protein